MGNSGNHNFSVITDYQLLKYIKRTLYNSWNAINPFDTLCVLSSHTESIWTFYQVSSNNLFEMKIIQIAIEKTFLVNAH